MWVIYGKPPICLSPHCSSSSVLPDFHRTKQLFKRLIHYRVMGKWIAHAISLGDASGCWRLLGMSQTCCCRLRAAKAPGEEPEQAQAYAALRIAPPEEFMASGIKSLAFVAGARSGGGRHALLALGGQRLDEPDLLHLLPLQPATAEVRDCTNLDIITRLMLKPATPEVRCVPSA